MDSRVCSGAVSGSVLLSQTGLLFTKGVQIAARWLCCLSGSVIRSVLVLVLVDLCVFSDYSGCLGYG